MMSALPQMPAQTGLASILAALGGGTPTAAGDAGFEALLAAAPAHGGTTVNAPSTIQIGLPVTIAPAAPLTIESEIAVDPAAPTPTAAPPTVHPASVEGRAATDAAHLLIALIGAADGAPVAEKPASAAPATVSAEAPAEAIVAQVTEAVAAPVVALLQAVTAAPAQTAVKPTKTAEASTVTADSAAPAAPISAKPRPAALPALTGADFPVTKPAAEAAPSMTVLFTQADVQGAATPIDVTRPPVVTERVLDMASDDMWIEQLVRDIAATKSDSGDISFRLMPRHLGRLDVAMQMGDEGVSLKLDTQHEATATLVTAAQGRLVEDLRQQGVRVAGAEVTCTPGETGRQSQQQGQGRSPATDVAHLIETATDGAEPRADRPHDERAAARRGRFA